MFPFGDFNFPGAAGNWQEIMTRWWSPNITMNFAGNAAIEREVNEDVASYGRQIGWLNDIVAALAKSAEKAVDDDPEAAGALKEMLKAREKIEEIKTRRKQSALERAREALGTLGVADKDAYRSLVRSLDPDRPPEST
jgi:hypothetical protein